MKSAHGFVVEAELAAIVSALVGRRYRFASERDLHDGVEQVLRAGAWSVGREVKCAAGRLDLLVGRAAPGRIAIEIKIGGALPDLHRQLIRYAALPELDALLVVTSRRAHDALPPTIDRKPVRVLVLGGFS